MIVIAELKVPSQQGLSLAGKRRRVDPGAEIGRNLL
jgi:hypothetical protein